MGTRGLRLRFPILLIRSRLAFLLLALVAVLATPAVANAADYEVNMDFDVAPEFGGCNSGPLEECSLFEAIGLANEDGEPSTITFDPALELITLNNSIPAIAEPVTIDGTDENGAPGVELNGLGEGRFTRAFEIEAAGTTIEGMAINTFEETIVVKAEGAAICNSYLGTDLSGEVAEPDEVGIWVTPAAEGTQIGGSACAGGGNVIGGNELFGILDEGAGTTIAGNSIGVGVGNTPLPNGTVPNPSLPAGGVYAQGTDTTIGGVAGGDGNVIAHNQWSSLFAGGGGVISESFSVTIRGNSIYDNEGPGIFFRLIGGPPSPGLESASSNEGGSTVVSGTVANEGTETFAVDIYANEDCDKYETGFEEFAEAGEGETYLGTATATTTPTGGGGFTASLPVQPQGTVLTATATRESDGATSEFSECLVAPAVTPKPPQQGNTPATLVVDPGPPPPTIDNGESVLVAPRAGTVFVTLPNGKRRKLKEGQTIPVGSIVDATRGKVVLTSVNRKGETQTAVFFGGVFLVQQQEGSGLVVLKLRGALNCGKAARSGRVAGRLERGGKKSRKLWGSGKGNFRTEGNNGSATVRGTIWLTEDRCSGTFFKVNQGVVTIRDFGANETFQLGKGKSYLATP